MGWRVTSIRHERDLGRPEARAPFAIEARHGTEGPGKQDFPSGVVGKVALRAYNAAQFRSCLIVSHAGAGVTSFHFAPDAAQC
jgi:hypothetical protein